MFSLPQEIYDMVRGMTSLMFVIVLFQVGYVCWHYLKVMRLEAKIDAPKAGLLPLHVMSVTVVLIWSLAECAIQNISRIGEPPNYFWFANPPMFALTIYSLSLVMSFEKRRYKYARLNTPDEVL